MRLGEVIEVRLGGVIEVRLGEESSLEGKFRSRKVQSLKEVSTKLD